MGKELDWKAVQAAAHELGIKPRTVEKWREADRGVPFKWWYRIAEVTAGKVTFKQLKSTRGADS